jgi:hypothetical protein
MKPCWAGWTAEEMFFAQLFRDYEKAAEFLQDSRQMNSDIMVLYIYIHKQTPYPLRPYPNARTNPQTITVRFCLYLCANTQT